MTTDLRAEIAAHVARIDAAEAALADCQRRVGRAYCNGQEDVLRRALEVLGRLVYEWAKGEGNDD